MKSLPKFRDKRGFTLIEILIVMAIVIGLFAIGSLIDISTITREQLTSAETTLVSVLEKARSRAMNNIGAMEHSVEVKTDKYVLDGGEIKRNSNIIITKSGADEFEITFAQLSGEPTLASLGVIELSDVSNPSTIKTIKIWEGGLIDW